jgi:hypothetical protein
VTIDDESLERKTKKLKRRAKRLAVYHKNLAKAEKREADDRRRGITERVHPLQRVCRSLPKRAQKGSKILQGGLPELGKRWHVRLDEK